MGLGHHETKNDLAMPLYMLSNSEKQSDSDDNRLASINFENIYSESSDETEKPKRKSSTVSVKSVASRISSYVTVVKDTVSEARQKIPGFREAENFDYQCCE